MSLLEEGVPGRVVTDGIIDEVAEGEGAEGEGAEGVIVEATFPWPLTSNFFYFRHSHFHTIDFTLKRLHM